MRGHTTGVSGCIASITRCGIGRGIMIDVVVNYDSEGTSAMHRGRHIDRGIHN